ncbi:hypothetical protein ACUH97_08075 [Dermabacteraceae bacterium P13088]
MSERTAEGLREQAESYTAEADTYAKWVKEGGKGGREYERWTEDCLVLAAVCRLRAEELEAKE